MRKPSVFLSLIGALAACGGDDGGSTTTGRTVNLTADGDAQTKVQTALIDAKEGDTLVFAAGTYHFTEELSLSVNKVTLRGDGEVIWDFAGQQSGNANGFSARAVTDFKMDSITVRDTKGDAVRVEDSTNVTFHKVKVLWSAGSAAGNGAYGLYPVLDTNVLIDECDVRGAADAGIYVGQSKNVVVRNSHAEGNVAGIEIENTDDAEVYGNTAVDNVGGILVFNLPNLTKKTGSRANVHDNMIISNNHATFAEEGSIVSYVPPGSGMVLFANDGAEIHGNTFMGNESVGIVIASCATVELLASGAVDCSDAAYDGFPEGLYIHDNTFSGNSTAPQGFYALFWHDHDMKFFDIVWDGVTGPSKPESADLCIGANGDATFARADPDTIGGIASTDLTAFGCTHAALPAIAVSW